MAKRETTEWDDLLVKMGIKDAPPEEKETPIDYRSYDVTQTELSRQKLTGAKTIDQISALEDESVDDEAFYEEYRRKRMEEMQKAAARAKYGYVKDIAKPEWVDEVTNLKGDWVVCHLYKDGRPDCQLMNARLDELSRKFRATKFVRIFAHQAVENWPDKNLPALLIYRDGNVKAQIIGLEILGGNSMTVADLEWALKGVGAVDSGMTKNPRARGFKGRQVQLGSAVGDDQEGSEEEDY